MRGAPADQCIRSRQDVCRASLEVSVNFVSGFSSPFVDKLSRTVSHGNWLPVLAIVSDFRFYMFHH